MRIFKLILKFFKRTEVPLTPEQEVALREQLRIMDDLDLASLAACGSARRTRHQDLGDSAALATRRAGIGREAQGGVGHQQHVALLAGDDLRGGRHARTQAEVAVFDV